MRALTSKIAAAASLGALVALAACSGTSDSQPAAATASAAQKGAAIVAAKRCSDCHQSDPSDATLAGSMLPTAGPKAYPPNLTPDTETGLGAWSDVAIVRAIREGVNDEGRALCNAMPRFHDMTDAEAAEVVTYLRSLAPVQRKVPETECATPNGG